MLAPLLGKIAFHLLSIPGGSPPQRTAISSMSPPRLLLAPGWFPIGTSVADGVLLWFRSSGSRWMMPRALSTDATFVP